MSRICGLVSAKADLDIAGHLRRIHRASWHEAPSREELWHAPRVGLGHISIQAVNPEPQPLFTEDGEHAIVFCGKIFDYAHLKRDLERTGIRFRHTDNDAEFLLHLVRTTGLKHLAELNGLFAAAYWDRQARRLWLMTDRYGFRMVYYHHAAAEGTLAFSSRLRGVVESGLFQPEANWAAWATFLYFGHHLGDDTHFKNVFILPPGSVLQFADNQISLRRYWDPNSVEVDETITHDDAVQGIADLFAQAMQRRNVPTQGKKAVFLSGGLDSRRIAAELARQGCEFGTYTTRGFSPVNEEGPLARQVADVLGFENTFVNLPSESFLTSYWPSSNALLDYECNMHQWILPLVDSLPDDVKVNYDGIAGDITAHVVLRPSCFSDPNVFQQARDESPEEVARKAVGPELSLCVLDKRLRREMGYERVVAAVASELRKYDRTENQLTWFYLLNRTRRGISLSPFRLVLLKAESFCPYLDNDLLEFTMEIPADIRLQNTLREAATRHAYPELNEVNRTRHKRGAAKQGTVDDIDYYGQRRRWLRSNLWRHFVKNNWLFDNAHALPRALQALALSWCRGYTSYLFTTSFLLFYEWMERYRPRVGQPQPLCEGPGVPGAENEGPAR